MAAASFAPLTVPVGGLSCEGCVRSARSAILGVEGVVWCEGPDLAKPVALVHATRSVGHEEVALALESVGLSAHPEGRETLASLLEALAKVKSMTRYRCGCGSSDCLCSAQQVWDGDGGVEVTLEALLAKLEAENPFAVAEGAARALREGGAAAAAARDALAGLPLPCGWRPPADEAFFEETKAEAPRRAAPAAAAPPPPARAPPPVSPRSSPRKPGAKRRSKASRAAAQGRRDDAALAEALSDRARSSGRTRAGLARGAAAVAVVGCALSAGLRRAGLGLVSPAPRPRCSLACRTTFETSGSAFASTFEKDADAARAVADLASKCGVTSKRGLRTHWWRQLCGGLVRFETPGAYAAAAVACGRALDDARLPDRADNPAPQDLKSETAAAIHAIGAVRQTRGDVDGALAAYADAHAMRPRDARYASAYADALAGATAAAMIRNEAYAAAHRMHALGRLCVHNAVCTALANARALDEGPLEGEPPFDLVARRKDLEKASAVYAALLKLADAPSELSSQLAAARTQHHWLKIALDPFGGRAGSVLDSLGRSEPRLGHGLR